MNRTGDDDVNTYFNKCFNKNISEEIIIGDEGKERFCPCYSEKYGARKCYESGAPTERVRACQNTLNSK